MLNDKNFLTYFLVEVMVIIIYILNRKFTTKVHRYETKYLTSLSIWLCCIYACPYEKRAFIYEGIPINANV
jgi:uncharacterized membrane protein